MKRCGKWFAVFAAVIILLLSALYLFARPLVAEKLPPLMKEAASEKLRGSLAWSDIELTPSFDLTIRGIVLKDDAGAEIFSSSAVTVGWSLANVFTAWKDDLGAAAMLRDVLVEKPVVHIRQSSDGSWNIQNLMKPQEEETENTFRGRILLKGGTAEVALAKGSHYRADDLAGQFSWLNQGVIDALLTGSWSDAPFTVRAAYTNEENFTASADTGDIPLEALSPILAEFPETDGLLTLRGGTGKITKADVASKDGTLTYHIAGSLDEAALTAEGYDVTEGKAAFDVTESVITAKDVRAKVNGEAVSGDLEVMLKDEMTMKGDVAFDKAELADLLPGEDISGKLSGTAEFSGTLKDPTASGSLFLTGGSLKGVGIEKGSVDISLADHLLTVTGLHLENGEGTLEGTGSYHLEKGDFRAEIAAENLSLAAAESLIPASGTVTGSFAAAGTYADGNVSIASATGTLWASGLSYDGYGAEALSGSGRYDGTNFNVRFTGDGLSAKGVTVDSAAGTASGTKDAWTIHDLSGTMGDGAFTARGTYDRGALDMKAEAGNIDISRFAGLAGMDIGGRLSFDAAVKGTMDAPVGTLTFEGRDGWAMGAAVRHASGRLSADGQTLYIESLDAETATGTHSLTGTVGIGGDHALALTEKSEHTRIENILKIIGADYPVTGWIQNETEIGGTAAAPEISGSFLAWDGSAAGELFQSISSSYALEGETLRISNGLAYIYGGTASLNGTISAKALDLDAALIDVELDRIARGYGVEGKTTFRGHISGAPDDPRFDGDIEARTIKAGDAEISQVTAGVFYENGLVRITDGFFRQADGKFRWDGTVNLNTTEVNGNLRFNDWKIANACKLFSLKVNSVTGTLDGGMRLRGTLDDPRVSFQMGVSEGMLGHTSMGPGTVEAAYRGGTLSIHTLSLPIGTGLLAGKGTASLDGEMDLSVAARDVDISWVPEVLGMKNTSFGGTLTAALDLGGTLESPRADMSVTLTAPSYNDIGFDGFSLMGSIADGTVHIDQALATKDIYKVSAKGTMPVAALTRIDDGRNIPFDISADLDNADLNALMIFAKPVTSAAGPIKGHVHISGAWDDPLVNGGISVKDGSITTTAMNEPISGIAAELAFGGKNAELTASASFGGGGASAAGNVSWDKMQLTGYAGEAHVHTPRIDSAYYKGALDADITASEERGLPKIAGTVDIANATIDIPLSMESGEGGTDLLMDVTVTLGEKVRFYNSLLYDMYVHGNIHAMGLLSRPLMSGKVAVDRGAIKYLSNEFTITEGTATWGGVPDTFMPTLNVHAVSNVGHYKVMMDVKGPADDMQLDLSSEPSLNDSQIVMLLTLRQAPGSSGEDNTTGALFNAGLQMLFSAGISDFLKDSFGLDMISVTTSLTDYYASNTANQRDDDYYIKLGKYLFNDFMLTATMGLNNKEQSYGFRYDLKSRVGLTAWYNTDNDSYVGADYQFRF